MEELIKVLIKELQGLRQDIKGTKVETCSPEEALQILGLNNKGYLKYFNDQGLLHRRKGGASFVYYKNSCYQLAEKLKEGSVIIPSVRSLYN